ncbi:sporulation protein YjcZ [Paenibacillus piri]|uniref:Sporulation protein YjcZ n=1 Tax=Paenibacillus piri TaxID=2547395 RepID=A0A4R5KWI5_9BACL|nr:sporulation protein YjcZ [Paenibacillus piri]TDG00390.1 sporulation protein YjcZ [Paenibacillus piri]
MAFLGGFGCGIGGNFFTSTAVILVLFILLVIVLRACI